MDAVVREQKRLKDRLIVVTGAAQGIGRAYARRLAEEGAHVVLADINEAVLKQAREALRGEGHAVDAFALDVASVEGTQEFAKQLDGAFGRVDGLVNNAAVFSSLKLKPFWEIEPAEWDKVMAVNVRGPWLLVSALLPLLRRSEGASVVNIGSDAVWMGKIGYMHYVASKGAVFGLTNAMSRELGSAGIRVNSLSPGFVMTEVPRETFTEEQRTAILKAQAFDRVADADDIVGAVAFLMSPESRWITGQTLHVNGGLLNH